MGRYAVALLVLFAAVFAFGRAVSSDGWGAPAQYGIGALAICALVAIGYAIPRVAVFAVPWAAVLIWVVVGVAADPEWLKSGLLDWFGGAILLGFWALLIAAPIAAGVLIRLAVRRLGRGSAAAT
jgi:hypothetical protein